MRRSSGLPTVKKPRAGAPSRRTRCSRASFGSSSKDRRYSAYEPATSSFGEEMMCWTCTHAKQAVSCRQQHDPGEQRDDGDQRRHPFAHEEFPGVPQTHRDSGAAQAAGSQPAQGHQPDTRPARLRGQRAVQRGEALRRRGEPVLTPVGVDPGQHDLAHPAKVLASRESVHSGGSGERSDEKRPRVQPGAEQSWIAGKRAQHVPLRRHRGGRSQQAPQPPRPQREHSVPPDLRGLGIISRLRRAALLGAHPLGERGERAIGLITQAVTSSTVSR